MEWVRNVMSKEQSDNPSVHIKNPNKKRCFLLKKKKNVITMPKFTFLLILIFFFFTVDAQDLPVEAKVPDDLQDLSGAEMLIRLQKFVSTDQTRLSRLKSRIKELNNHTQNLTKLFNRLDSELLEAKKNNNEVDEIEERWTYARKALDLLLQQRHAVQQQIQIIEKKLEKQHEVIDFITLREVPLAEEDTLRTIIPDSTATEKVTPIIQNRRVLDAIEELERLELELKVAKHSLALIEQLIKLNREDLALAKILQETSENQIILYSEWIDFLQNKANIRNSQQILNNAQNRLREFTVSISQDSALVDALQARIDVLEKVYTPVASTVNNAEKKVESAREKLEFLQSPLAPHQIFYWLKYNFPRLLIILAVLIVFWFLIRRGLGIILNKLKKRRIGDERLERIETLKLASNSVITILILLIGILVLLSEIGVDLTVVLGGAAVISLAIAFGAQSLVKDYFSGFMILLENQYRVGNVVKINNTTGVVENISIRLTVLRDIEGIAHFIPHGQITEVSNLTHGWSQVSFDIGVSYKENVDEVISILKELSFELKDDPDFGPFIIGDPDMLGVNAFADSAVVIKFLIKTKPLKQWVIKRELLRRIKNRFDELGIEIPFPHRTVFIRDNKPPMLNDDDL